MRYEGISSPTVDPNLLEKKFQYGLKLSPTITSFEKILRPCDSENISRWTRLGFIACGPSDV